MEANPTRDLSQLKDIVVPEAAGLWPLAPGWYWLFGVVTVVLCLWAWKSYQRWKANAYRREAIVLMETSNPSPYQIFKILKRVALMSFGREQVARLAGEEWIRFLQNTSSGVDLNALKQLNGALYASDGKHANSNELALVAAKQWIKCHDAGKDVA